MSKSFKMVEWAAGANIYEVNIRQYTQEGTFNAFAKHLPRLKDMGIKILWLMPVTPISIEKRQGTLGSYYACSNYTSINPEFGTIDDFKQFVHDVHAMDMKIIIDWVANHTGYDHHWVKENPEYYLKDADGNFTEENGWMDVIDLDYTNNDMRRAMIASMKFWVNECDIDGFRCDMAHLVPLDFWQDARTECDAVKNLFWLAECDEPSYLNVFDTSYAWNWMHVSEKLARGEVQLSSMMDVLHIYEAQKDGPCKLFFTSNHDENSWNGTEYEKYGTAVKAFAIFTATWPGMSLIYSGQELPNYKRLKFFDKDEINWGNEKPSLQEFYKTLFSLRYGNRVLKPGINFFVLTADDSNNILSYIFENGDSKILVLINFSSTGKKRITLTHSLLKGGFENIFSGLQYNFSETESFELQEWEALVYEGVV